MDERDFFGKYGNRLTLEDQADAAGKLQAVECSFETRVVGQQKHLGEWNCFRSYIISLLMESLISFPIVASKEGTPDFIIRTVKDTIGLEVTNASNPDFDEACSRLRTSPDAEMIDLSHLRIHPGELSSIASSYELVAIRQALCLPKASREKAIKKRGEPLTGDGWDGDSMEQEMAVLLASGIVAKLAKLNGPNWLPADRAELVLYNDNSASLANTEKALVILRKHVQRFLDGCGPKQFDAVSVISGPTLHYDVLGRNLRLRRPACFQAQTSEVGP